MNSMLRRIEEDRPLSERVVRLEVQDETQEEKLDNLAGKIDGLVEVVHDLKNGQDVVLAQFSAFQVLCEERVNAANEVITDYKKNMIRVEGKFHTVDREMMRQAMEMDELNWVRSMPKKLTISAIVALMSSAVVLVTSLWADIVKFIK